MRRLLVSTLLLLPVICAGETGTAVQGNKTVIGPTNVDLQDGTDLLRAGDPRAAIPLLERGLRIETSLRNVVAGLSNLCAAHALIEDYEKAIRYCTMALERNDSSWHAYNNRALAYIGTKQFDAAARDIDAGLNISPNAMKLSQTRQRLEHAMNPVTPTVIIDDRKLPDSI